MLMENVKEGVSNDAFSYADTVAAGMKNKEGANEWWTYLGILGRFQARQKELMKELGRKRKGMSPNELARAVKPILQREGLCEGLPEYVTDGY